MNELDDWFLTQITILQKDAFLTMWTLKDSQVDDLFDRYTIQYAEILGKSVERIEAQAHTRILTILSNELRAWI